MSFLRSSFFIAIVSLFILTGYAHGVFGDCCAHEKQTQSAGTAPDHQTDDCQCLCHQTLSHLTAEPVRAAAGSLVPMMVKTDADEFPPDAVPPGIEVPPQLA